MRTLMIDSVAMIILVSLTVGESLAQPASRNALVDGNGIFKMAIQTNFQIQTRDLRVVLAQVDEPISRPGVPSINLSWIAYEMTVLYEYRQLIAEGSRIRIVNPTTSIGGGKGPRSLPSGWGPGTIFLMVVATAAEQGEFEWAGWAQLIGVEMPCEVTHEDVLSIKAALLKLGEIAERGDGVLSRQEALALLDVKDNYYLWAIGAAGLAAWNDKPAVDELYKRWRSTPTPKPREIIWLDHCFERFVSEELRPSMPDRHQMLLQFLRRLDPISPPTTAPAGQFR